MTLAPCPLPKCGAPAEKADRGGDERNGYAHTVTIACTKCGVALTRTDRSNPRGGYALATAEAEVTKLWNDR